MGLYPKTGIDNMKLQEASKLILKIIIVIIFGGDTFFTFNLG